MKTEPLFYLPVPESDGEMAGPYDLVQLAGLLRKKIISAETLTCVEGEEEWTPFGDRPQYIVAREMPGDAISMRAAALDEEARASRSPIPLPSRETLLKLAGLAGGILLAGAGGYLMGRADVVTGRCLELAGGAAALGAQCMILARLLDEDFWTLVLVFFVPLGDLFYFISNLWEYFPWFCVKYVGAAACAGAAMGLAAGSFH